MTIRSKRPLNWWMLAGFVVIVILINLVIGLVAVSIRAEAFADEAFRRVWNRSDSGGVVVGRSYLWGPEPFTIEITEDYEEAPGGKRKVQYFDKSRMELTNPNGDRNSPFYVTNGLLVNELMTGQMQLGDAKFIARSPSFIGVAGDPDDVDAPNYFALGQVRTQTPSPMNVNLTQTLDKFGNTGNDASFAQYNVKPVTFVSETNHTIAEPFWQFLNQTGRVVNNAGAVVTEPLFSPTFYATGFPVTEAYWAKVRVAGQVKDVLVQGFERRVLTFTPSNSAAFRVEMGNVGRHYYRWRYESNPSMTVTASVEGNAFIALCNGQSAPATTALSAGVSVANKTLVQGEQILCIAVNKNNRAVEGAQVAITTSHKGETRRFTTTPTNRAGKAGFKWQVEALEKGVPVNITVSVTYLGETTTTELSWTPQ
jgi:hypothetical protein